MEDLIELVLRMRNAQKEYFRARKNGDQIQAGISLSESKRLEGQVDKFIQQYKADKGQPKLF